MPARSSSALSSPIDRVVVQPGVGMLGLFPAMNYKPWYAIGEFVDNALQSWLANRSAIASAFGSANLLIDIDLDEKAGTITVTDNAAGINTADIPRAFTPASPPADATGLSEFGIGMKSAATWYAERFSVTTTALGEPIRRSVVFDVPTIIESNTSTIPLREEPATASEHGTTLRLEVLNHPIPKGRTLGKIRDYLASIYRSFLLMPEVTITVKGRKLVYKEPTLLDAPRWDRPEGPVIHWRKDIDFTLPTGARIKGWAGILAKGKARQAGFALLYRGKVVKGAGGAANDADDGYKPVEVFGAANSFESQRLIGELNVVGVPVTHTKDALLWQGDDEEVLVQRLADVLDAEPLPLLRMARGYRATERGRNAQNHIEKALDSVAKTLEQPMPPSLPPVSTTAREKASRPESSAATPPAVAEPVERSIHPSEAVVGLSGEECMVRVIDAPEASDKWMRVTQGDSQWEIEINRSHPFMQSFANVPNMDIEPVIRLAVGFALVQVRARRSGSIEPNLIVPWINQLVTGPLSRRIEL